MHAVTLAGSVARASRSERLLGIAAEYLSVRHVRVDRIAVRELPPAALMHGDATDDAIVRAIDLVAQADVVIVATPVYKAAYSGVLKAFLDLLPQNALRDKAVLPIATGGSTAHMLAVDYALKPVLAALGARYVLGTVYVVDSDFAFIEGAGFQATNDVERRLDEGLAHLVKALHWTRQRKAGASLSPHVDSA